MSVTKDTGFPVTSRDTTANAHDLTWPAFTTPGSNHMVVALYIANGTTVNLAKMPGDTEHTGPM